MRGKAIHRTMVLLAGTALVAGACSSSSPDTAGPPAAATGATSGNGVTGSGSGSGAGTTTTAKPAKPVARFAGFTDPTYTNGDNWLCGPGIATKDRCLTENLDTTVIKADGTTEVRKSVAAAAPTIDCFYVYPTVNFSASGGNDEAMAADPANEESVVKVQAARLREQCRVFAPFYRQLMGGAGSMEMAYGDVRNSFKQYMAQWNQGRPIVLIGHSQGSGMLAKLMTDEFDNDPEMRALLVSAQLYGGSTNVPTGKKVGGTFQNIPACEKADQNGCVIGFNSVGADGPDEDRTRWGAGGEGTVRLCTNVADLAGGGPAKVTPIVAKGTEPWIMGQPAEAITTPFVELPDAVTAECQTKTIAGKVFSNLALRATAAAGDVRAVTKLVTPGPAFWALHIQEVQLNMRNVLDLIKTQAAAHR